MKASYKDQKPSFQVPKRTWIRRNPKAFQFITVGVLLFTFFSKTLYEAFIAEPIYRPRHPPIEGESKS